MEIELSDDPEPPGTFELEPSIDLADQEAPTPISQSEHTETHPNGTNAANKRMQIANLRTGLISQGYAEPTHAELRALLLARGLIAIRNEDPDLMPDGIVTALPESELQHLANLWKKRPTFKSKVRRTLFGEV